MTHKEFSTKGGQAKTPAKRTASRTNGTKGGRPKSRQRRKAGIA